ncbi:MAG: substrate-binding domain-containing protein [Phycisphaeraceae bacterium JB051]
MAKPLTATKYFRVMQALRQEWSLWEPGTIVPTVNDLKERFSASQTTVTQALSRLQDEGVIHRPDGRNRLVVSEQAPQVDNRIALIRPSASSPDYDALTRALVRESDHRGWALDVDASHSDMNTVNLNRCIGQNDAAVLMVSQVNIRSSLLAGLRKPSRPVVTVLDVPDYPEISGVSADSITIGRTAISHLIDHGHSDILTVISEPRTRSNLDRAQGARARLLEHGVSHADELVLDCQVRPPADSIALSYERICEFLTRSDRPRFSAVFCVAWTGAFAMMKALNDIGKWSIPQDVSLVTYAGESLLIPFLIPPLTAVQTDVDEYARCVMDLLADRLEDPQIPARHIHVPCSLIERESVIDRLASRHPQGI